MTNKLLGASLKGYLSIAQRFQGQAYSVVCHLIVSAEPFGSGALGFLLFQRSACFLQSGVSF